MGRQFEKLLEYPGETEHMGFDSCNHYYRVMTLMSIYINYKHRDQR